MGWGGVEIKRGGGGQTHKKSSTLLDLCVSSLRRGHAMLLSIVPILTDVPRKESSQILEITIFGHSYDPRAFSSISSRPGHLPATVWFSCSENHLCQVECLEHKEVRWTRQWPRPPTRIVRDPHLALATALEFMRGR